ncbi:DNA-binding transcriptional regulator, MarR family [Lutibacter oricola]|uniref:DNA-binding transcriptional regulator, MarR family n=1 Tax=Lutibacter oricola TaxID=762486 RepID=A0A1H2W4H2_9FLAO|nr:MarR family transcriptional regulator [Lutibacter oricola]SDW75366.1 DNA-binding transcriptional regulator, MarR family [Lutibacter oricola]
MDAEENLIPWIGRTGKMLGAVIKSILKSNAINLTREQFIILKILEKNNGLPQNDLAFITESDKTSLSRLISNMEKKQLISRKSIKGDKRVKNVYITPNGIKVYQNTLPIIVAAMKKFQQGISEKEIELTINIIKKIQNNISKEHSIKL